MCNFTDNMLKEFKYINKRIQDKILYEVGVYKEMPEDERAPPKRDGLKIYQTDVNLQQRPASAQAFTPDFDAEIDRISEEAGARLKDNYLRTVELPEAHQ